jgi:hypothetical protein
MMKIKLIGIACSCLTCLNYCVSYDFEASMSDLKKMLKNDNYEQKSY